MFGKIGDLYKLQKEAKEMQSNLKNLKISGLSNNEDVEIVMDGTQEILEIGINDSLLSIDKKRYLEKAIIDAMKDAQKKIQKELMKDMNLDKIKQMLGN
ncbi:YbaB/EbfC family nucleoid-associated protein [Candidatus Dojkabacteria bacterium]|nr:YbaB/EbfC family nucleoid-associated protein [Candidatus Dojkabacteria bacterium]